MMKIFAVGLILLGCATLRAQDIHVAVQPGIKPDTTHFPTVQMALDHAPEPRNGARLYLHIAPGIYKERVWVSRRRVRTTFLGEGKNPSDVVITASMNATRSGGTFFTETVEVDADEFEADNLTFENSAGPTGQALAIAVSSDRAIFKRCRFLGDQDTLFADYGRQYYVDSYIAGGVDFIFGNAAAVIDKSELHILHQGYLTAQSRTNLDQNTGYVITHSRVTAADMEGHQFFLGRPWRSYARVVFLYTDLSQSLDPRGWSEWKQNSEDLAKTYFAEYENTGPGASLAKRVPWSHELTKQQAEAFTPQIFLQGTDHWNPIAEAAKLP